MDIEVFPVFSFFKSLKSEMTVILKLYFRLYCFGMCEVHWYLLLCGIFLVTSLNIMDVS